MQTHFLNVRGAYGRDASLIDWYSGKDMKIFDGPYCSIRDTDRMKKDGYTHVRLFVLSPTVQVAEVVL